MVNHKKVLVTGASGFLGAYLMEALPTDLECHVIQHQHSIQNAGHVTIHQIDLTDRKALAELLQQIEPTHIIHLAAISDTTYCEQHSEESSELNVRVTQNLAKWAASNNAWLFFASSDLVFDGENAPYGENDEPDPVNEYGCQKLDGEEFIRTQRGKYTIGRLPLMYGEKGQNTLTGMAAALKVGNPLYLFVDEFRTPAYAADVAEMIWKLLGKAFAGTIHLGGPAAISRYQMGVELANVLKIDHSLLIAKKQKEADLPAPRPQDVSMDNSRAFKLGYTPAPFKNVLPQLKEYL